MGQGTGTRTRWAKRRRGRCQKWRMASVAEGHEGMNVRSMDPQMRCRAPDQRQQRLWRWGTGSLADAGIAGRTPTRRQAVQASLSARHQGICEACGATVSATK